MIFYDPLSGEPSTASIAARPRTCFLITQLGAGMPPAALQMRKAVQRAFARRKYQLVDAGSEVTGRDFLLKILKMIYSVPLAVAIFHQDMHVKTQLNIFYELGVAQAMGKETIIVKAPGSTVPSDFVRTEYVEFNGSFSTGFGKFLDSLFEAAEYYETAADQLDRNPLLALDYLRRAYLITGDGRLRKLAQRVLKESAGTPRAQNSVEALAASF